MNWISFGFIILALLMIHKGSVLLGEFLLVIGVFSQWGQSVLFKKRTTSSNPTPPVPDLNSQRRLKPIPTKVPTSSPKPVSMDKSWISSLGPLFWFLILIAAGIFFFFDLMGFPSHSWMFPSMQVFPFKASYQGLLATWILMGIAMMRLPQTESSLDLSPRISRWVFFLILALGIFMVGYRPFWPVGAISEDNIVHSTTSRLVNQLGDWKVFWDAGIGTNWPPFNSMFVSFLWLFDPDMTGLTAQKLANVLYEVAFIFIIYLAGKEAVSRRTGLLAATLCAISHPLITKSVGGLLGNSNAVTVILPIWLFFRAMNRPKMSNFLWWGAALALSIYTYVVNRPFLFAAVVGALAWILIQREEERVMDRPTLALVGGTLGAFVLYTVYTNTLFSTDNFLTRTLDASGFLVPCLALGALWIMGLYLWPKVFNSGKYPFFVRLDRSRLAGIDFGLSPNRG